MRKKKPKLLATRRQHVRRNGARPERGVAVQCFIDGDLSATHVDSDLFFVISEGGLRAFSRHIDSAQYAFAPPFLVEVLLYVTTQLQVTDPLLLCW